MRIEAVRGDITRETADAIVNAANSALAVGGGVDGAINAAGGPAIAQACRELRRTTLPDGLPTGDAVATTAGRLAATWVIHTVGPRAWEHPDHGADLLRSCHERSLAVADELGCASVAFPAISCGVFGWTAEAAAPIAVAAVRDYAAAHPGTGIASVRFVLFDVPAHAAFSAALA